MEKTIGDIAQEHYMTEGRPTPPPPGRYRVVEDRDLDEVTSYGSIVVRVLDRTVLHTKSVVKWITDTQGYRRDSRESESVWGPGQAFLVFTPIAADEHEKALKDALAVSQGLRERTQTAEGKLRDLERLHAKKNEEYTASLEAERAITALSKRIEKEAVDRSRRMELDLAKVRREIGEAAWKKIVA